MLAMRHAKYLGSFPVSGDEHVSRADYVSERLRDMKDSGRCVPVLLVVSLTGVKICRPEDQSVRMAHALRRISYATCEATRALFGLVAREPRASPTQQYCHAFGTDTPQQAEELNTLVGDAFRMAFASQLQPSAPLWSAELSGVDRGGMRAPDSLPLAHTHYPLPHRCSDRSPTKCEKLLDITSPSSSEESNSPTELHSYRRLGDKPPLMKRLAMGFSGALLQPSDDDSTPLVTDTPTTPTNLPLCINGGYVNEGASEAEVRTRESNRESPVPLPRHQTMPHHVQRNDNIPHNGIDLDFKKHNILKNSCKSSTCSRGTSSSSGGSSCGSSGNNNASPQPTSAHHSATAPHSPAHILRVEPDLMHAPWFQAGIPREIALEVLSHQPVGAFMVRCSSTQNGCFALSVRVPRHFAHAGIAHYLILRVNNRYKIKGFTKEFSSLTALVTHHSVMPELLPCPLWLQRYNPAYNAHLRADDLADPDYTALADFRHLMCDRD